MFNIWNWKSKIEHQRMPRCPVVSIQHKVVSIRTWSRFDTVEVVSIHVRQILRSNTIAYTLPHMNLNLNGDRSSSSWPGVSQKAVLSSFSPNSDENEILFTSSLLVQTFKWWEYRKQSPRIRYLNKFSLSIPYEMYKQNGKENTHFHLRAWKVHKSTK